MKAGSIKSSSQQRHAFLLDQIHCQRADLISTGQDISNTIRKFEAGVHAVRQFGAPQLVGLGAFATLLIMRPKRALWAIKTGYACWRFWRQRFSDNT